MSLKLNNVQLDAQARQDGISTNGKLGDRSASLKANVNASLPEGWSAKLTVTDKTASDLAKNVSLRPAGANLELRNGDRVRLGFNLHSQKVQINARQNVNVANREVQVDAEYRQGERDHEVDVEASHELDSNTRVRLNYGVHNKELTAALRYRMDNSTIEPQVNLSNQHWKVSLEHKLSSQDHVEAHLEKDNDPRLAYVRNQDGVEVRLEAPVRSDIAASARIRVQRTFDL